MYRIHGVAVCCVWVLLAGLSAAGEPAKKKLQIYILAGQSNMVGHANAITIPALLTSSRPDDKRLAAMVFQDPAAAPGLARELVTIRNRRDAIGRDLKAKKFADPKEIASAQAELAKLQTDLDAKTAQFKSAFRVSKRTYITSIGDNHRRSGPLTIGYGGNIDKIGPELGFGLSLEQQFDAPILLIKTSWGGKSLHYDFRPPSAGPYELTKEDAKKGTPESIQEKAGLNYRLMTATVRDVLNDLKSHHPGYDPNVGHEIAGFVWFQGFNDQFSPAFRDNYKNNMIAFVKDIRKEYQSPALPFVIGVMGVGITKEGVDKNAISVSQREASAIPEFRGNVAAVESYLLYDTEAYAIFQAGWAKQPVEWPLVGSDRPYHYLGSGRFFVRLGDALAAAMTDLRKPRR